MKLIRAALFYAICAVALAADAPVQMDAFRVRPTDFLVDVEFSNETQLIVQIRVHDILRGSGAEKRGIRAGDRIVAIDGKPVTSLKRSDVFLEKRLLARDEITFEGKRGLFGKKWSETVRLAPRKAAEPDQAPGSVPASDPTTATPTSRQP